MLNFIQISQGPMSELCFHHSYNAKLIPPCLKSIVNASGIVHNKLPLMHILSNPFDE